eukprot:CAMPEP_0172648428 /NCGR_PEP_ID=MMETSP1068-20121228/241266_1 /TAXON_ID=35684 /ORGANISM="Pseudopedinella elastica, Strain CCMP716" /LENGTH=522 /DNA_ID=CAMNT_0013462749 /DNA_START=147 /DNA_END=1715 /DNA_ORIENTATION=-
MSTSAIFIMDVKGKIIISRNYRGDVPMSVSERFSTYIQDTEESEMRPIFTEEGYTFVYIKHNNLYLMTVTKRNANVALMLMYLYRLVTVFKDYFGELEEESIRDNFVIIYELLDETNDYGYPQSMDSKILREYITQESNRHEVVARPPIAVTNAVSWRSEGIKHRKNEIFLDVIEKLNLLVSSNGTVLNSEIVGAIKMKSFLSGAKEPIHLDGAGGLVPRPLVRDPRLDDPFAPFFWCCRFGPFAPLTTMQLPTSLRPPLLIRTAPQTFCVSPLLNLLVSSNGTVLNSEIVGAIKMKSFLSGMPELKLGLNDKLMFEATGRPMSKGKAVELEDIKFHQCVRLARFENDRTISFIPPDGEFDLMNYRLSTHVKPLIWVEAVVEPHSNSRIEYMIKAKSQFKSRSIANNVEIIIPVPSDVDSPSFKSSIGTVVYLPDKDCVVWSIKQFNGSREYLMRAHFGLPSISAEEPEHWRAPIEVQFEIPYFTVSGIQVRYLKIIEKSGYQALPWVRYITQNGDYQLRMT